MTPAKKTAAPVDAPAAEPAIEGPLLEEPLPSGAVAEAFGEEPAAVEPEAAAPVDAPARPNPRRFIVLNGPASYGPVVINGRAMRAKAGEVYEVPDAEERADILASGLFRGATSTDFAKKNPTGSITRDSLPPGALKGGLTGR